MLAQEFLNVYDEVSTEKVQRSFVLFFGGF